MAFITDKINNGAYNGKEEIGNERSFQFYRKVGI